VSGKLEKITALNEAISREFGSCDHGIS
jgi:hypothetical protein